MKKKLLIAVLIMALLIPACFVAADYNNIRTKGVQGNWVIYDGSGNIICTFDATNRKITIPSGSNITVSSGGTMTLTGTATLTTPIIASFYQDAAKVNLLTAPASPDTLVGAAYTQTLTNKTLTSPAINTPSIVGSVATHDYAAGTTDWTLSDTEMKADLLYVVGAGGSVNVIVPSAVRKYYLWNQSGQTVTVKKSGGVGIAVANGKVAGVMYATSDVVRTTADASQ